MSEATPALPLPAIPPTGSVRAVLEGRVGHALGAAACRKFVKMYVVPEESPRATTTILWWGSLTLLFRFWIDRAVPVLDLAAVDPSQTVALRTSALALRPGTLYAIATPPRPIGTWRNSDTW